MKTNKYSREIKPGVFVDVYDVLNAFKTGSSAVDHAVKKLLAPGERGVKPREQDLKEAVASIERAIEIENQWVEDVTVEVQKTPCIYCNSPVTRNASSTEPPVCSECHS